VNHNECFTVIVTFVCASDAPRTTLTRFTVHVYVTHPVAGQCIFSAQDMASRAENVVFGCVINGTLTSFHHIMSSAAAAAADMLLTGYFIATE